MKCPTDKRQFHCRNDAIDENIRFGKSTGTYCNVYRCDYCNDFHLTSRRINGIITSKLFYKKERLEYLIDKMRKL